MNHRPRQNCFKEVDKYGGPRGVISHKVQVLILLFTFFQFYSVVSQDYYYYYYLTPCEFFSPVVTGVFFIRGLSDSKSTQISRTLLADFQRWLLSIIPLIFRSHSFFLIGKCSKGFNYNWYHCHFHVPQLFLLFRKVQVLVYFFTFFYFQSIVRWNCKIHKKTSLLLLLILLFTPLEFFTSVLADGFSLGFEW